MNINIRKYKSRISYYSPLVGRVRASRSSHNSLPHKEGWGGSRARGGAFILTIILCFFAMTMNGQRARFCNLSAEELKIDSVMPRVAYHYDLVGDAVDSTFTVNLKYPEFYDMPAEDVAAYRRMTLELPPAMPVVETARAVSRKQTKVVADFCPVVYRDGKYQYLASFMIEWCAEKRTTATGPLMVAAKAGVTSNGTSRYAAESVLNKGKWAKIRVAETGIHVLTTDVVKKAGFSDPSRVKIYGYGGNMVPESLSGTYLTQYDDLKEVASCMVGGKRLFYARGPVSWASASTVSRVRNPYSDYGYYFLTESDESPLMVNEEDFKKSFYPAAEDYHWLYEIDDYSWQEWGRNLCGKETIEKGNSRDYSVQVPEGNTSLRLTISSTADEAGAVEVYFNGTLLGKQAISKGKYDKYALATTTWAVASGVKTDNVVTVKNVSCGTYRLDYIQTMFTTPRAYPDLQTTAFPQPEYVYRITNQNLHAHDACDMVIIIATSQNLLQQAERLKELHERNDGLKVRIVPADELYNEFSSGTPDVSAYRRYMKMLYDRAETEKDMPRFLLMLGDCVWDNRMKTVATKSLNPDNYLLCYESENSSSETDSYVSDDFIAMLDDEEVISTGSSAYGIPDVGVGRIPVSTASGAKVAVDKIEHYMQNMCDAPWQNTIMFLGDDGNNNIHMADVNMVADSVASWYPGYNLRKVMWDAYTRYSTATGHRYPDVENAVKKQQAEGALIIDYAGHGSPRAMSHEQVLTIEDFSNFRGNNHPLWVTATCDIMPFDGTLPTIGETAFLNDKGGAIAFYGTARTVLSNYNKHVNRLYIKHVLGTFPDGTMMTIGDANRVTKDSLVTYRSDRTVNKLQYSLMGDPALKLARPRLTVVIDSINGEAVEKMSKIELRAGSITTVSGHIVSGGVKAEDFDGQVNVMIRDSRQLVTCKLNNTLPDEGADVAFQYYDYTSVLYQGVNTVTKGDFLFRFAMPKDISYTDGNGLITMYARNDSKTLSAHGEFSKFNISGGEQLPNDSIGPSIYCYLNSTSFVNGATVNSTPFFVAEVYDEDGVNVSTGGIGHDMQLIIDGQPSRTYSLNDNFQFDFGSYTTGQAYYVIPKLDPGQHTLRFRAWDIHNNPSVASLSFVVSEDVAPKISHMYATPNPASDSVSFIVSHDMPGSELYVAIDVMDATGRLLWTTSEYTTTSDSYYKFDWNLCLDGGVKLNTGVYLYRVRMGNGASEKASSAKKLVVVRR